MADAEHVALARSGPNAISRWREVNFMVPNQQITLYSLRSYNLGDRSTGETFEPDFIVGRARLDLSGAYLSGIKLPRADLSHDNLSRADLTGCTLRMADLEGTNLQSACLSRSDISNAVLSRSNMSDCSLVRSNLSSSVFQLTELSGADLSRANLRYANMEGADLSGANLTSADLSWANLNGANLRGARLTATSLSLADLSGADLRDAVITKVNLESAVFMNTVLGQTQFINCDLSQAIGLESARHTGPSNIGMDTVAKSRGTIPRAFLQNAGVAAPLLEAQEALRAERRAFPSVLIVVAGTDDSFAERLRSGLTASQIPSWIMAADDETAMASGEILSAHIIYYDRLVLVCSRASLESPLASQYFAELTGRAISDIESTIVSLPIDERLFSRDDRLCSTLQNCQMVDFQGWTETATYDESLSKLVNLLSRTPW